MRRSKSLCSNAVLCVGFWWQMVKTHMIRLRGVEGQNVCDQTAFLVESPNKYWPQTCDACKIEVNIRQQFSFSFSELWYTPLEFNSGKIYHHLPNWTRWNKHDKVWTSVNILFKWRFCIRRHRCCLSSLMSILRKFKYRSIYISIYQHHNGQTIHTVKLK